MIQEFSVQNYRSFRDKQTISFLATDDMHLSEELTVEVYPGVRLLRMAMIYGTNSSGKSNIYHAIYEFWFGFYGGHEEDEKNEYYTPFATRQKEPTRMDCTFWANNRKYRYEIEFNDRSVKYEKLQCSTTESDELLLMYERKGKQSILFGPLLNLKQNMQKQIAKAFGIYQPLITSIGRNEVDIPLITELFNWVEEHVPEIPFTHVWKIIHIVERAEKDPEHKQFILDGLNKADFNISDFRIKRIKIPAYLRKTSFHFALGEDETVVLTHQIEDKQIDINSDLESSSFNNYFSILSSLFNLKSSNNNNIYLDSRLDCLLHHDLLIHFLKIFLQTTQNSQLIFTTHDLLLLDEDSIIRRDMIWLTQKEKDGSTTLHSAVSMDLDKDMSLLNAYRTGKLVAKPLTDSTL